MSCLMKKRSAFWRVCQRPALRARDFAVAEPHFKRLMPVARFPCMAVGIIGVHRVEWTVGIHWVHGVEWTVGVHRVVHALAPSPLPLLLCRQFPRLLVIAGTRGMRPRTVAPPTQPYHPPDEPDEHTEEHKSKNPSDKE